LAGTTGRRRRGALGLVLKYYRGGGSRDEPYMKFLLIDDHVLIREALRSVLKELRRDADVLEAANCDQAKRLVEEHTDLEVILLDLSFAGW
jgi:CheY-like chemotaxis protein